VTLQIILNTSGDDNQTCALYEMGVRMFFLIRDLVFMDTGVTVLLKDRIKERFSY
jgi:hypothetical protein